MGEAWTVKHIDQAAVRPGDQQSVRGNKELVGWSSFQNSCVLRGNVVGKSRTVGGVCCGQECIMGKSVL